jgi:dienelactone hydrolase
MLRMSRLATAAVVACLVTREAAAQPQRPPAWRFHYPEPPAAAVRVVRGVPFGVADSARLAMDVYRPAGAVGPAPALILFSLQWQGDRPSREVNDQVIAWARIAAANGIVAVIPDLRAEPGTGTSTAPARALGDDLARVVAHLTAHAREYGLDGARLALFAASGNVAAALPAVQDPRQTGIRAAVMYYGMADVSALRLDLPLLYVRAGQDSREMNAGIDRVVALALAQNAPLTLLNHHTGHHAFEAVDDDAATRQAIDETIAFVKRATAPDFQAVVRARQLDAAAAAYRNAGNYRDAARTFAELVAQRPAEPRLRFNWAEMLLADGQYAAACTEFRRQSPPSFAAIEPGTRACVLAGAVDSAAAWLGTIRRDWFRSDYLRALRTDSAYAPLWGRADFQALFRP